MKPAGKLSIASAVALLTIGLAACGGDDDSGSSTAKTAPRITASDGRSTSQANAGDRREDSGSGSSDFDSDRGSGDSGGDRTADDFVPGEHDDSGGGADQFLTKGGDNSIQEYGEEAPASEMDEAAAALHNFLDARAAGDWASACSFLATDVVETLEKLASQAKELQGADCAAILGRLTNPAATEAIRAEAAQADVASLRVEGDGGFVIYRGIDDAVQAVAMRKEDGEWKVGSLAGTPIL
jgi:hypothetical protein